MLVPFGCMLNLYYQANMTDSPCKNCENCECDEPKAQQVEANPTVAFQQYLAANPSNLEARIYDV